MAQQDPSSGYGGTWKRWIWVYLVVAAVVYGIVYFVFLKDSGGGNGGGNTGYLMLALSPGVFQRIRSAFGRR